RFTNRGFEIKCRRRRKLNVDYSALRVHSHDDENLPLKSGRPGRRRALGGFDLKCLRPRIYSRFLIRLTRRRFRQRRIFCPDAFIALSRKERSRTRRHALEPVHDWCAKADSAGNTKYDAQEPNGAARVREGGLCRNTKLAPNTAASHPERGSDSAHRRHCRYCDSRRKCSKLPPNRANARIPARLTVKY